jgi:hypothetical protein
MVEPRFQPCFGRGSFPVSNLYRRSGLSPCPSWRHGVGSGAAGGGESGVAPSSRLRRGVAGGGAAGDGAAGDGAAGGGAAGGGEAGLAPGFRLGRGVGRAAGGGAAGDGAAGGGAAGGGEAGDPSRTSSPVCLLTSVRRRGRGSQPRRLPVYGRD